MKWYNILYRFWMSNLENHVKRISIGFGSFLVVLLTTCTLPTPIFLASLYGASISFGTMVIMSIFGKNGNGQPIVVNDKPKETIQDSYDKLIREYKPELEPEPVKEKITIP